MGWCYGEGDVMVRVIGWCDGVIVRVMEWCIYYYYG